MTINNLSPFFIAGLLVAATNDPEEQRLLALHYVTVFTDNNGGIALTNFEAETEDRLGSPICPHHVKV